MGGKLAERDDFKTTTNTINIEIGVSFWWLYWWLLRGGCSTIYNPKLHAQYYSNCPPFPPPPMEMCVSINYLWHQNVRYIRIETFIYWDTTLSNDYVTKTTRYSSTTNLVIAILSCFVAGEGFNDAIRVHIPGLEIMSVKGYGDVCKWFGICTEK